MNFEMPLIEYPPSYAIRSLVLRKDEDERENEILKLSEMVVRQDEVIQEL